MKTITKHIRDFLIPIFVTIVLPLTINRAEHLRFGRPLLAQSALLVIAGVLVGLAGVGLMLSAIILMIRIAKSTVMPWDPSQHLVVAGPYRHLRNPMILGVILLLLGEALILSSYGIAILALAFFILNTIYFIYVEEPRLEKQFGEAYRHYTVHVPRWLPRVKPWYPQDSASGNKA